MSKSNKRQAAANVFQLQNAWGSLQPTETSRDPDSLMAHLSLSREQGESTRITADRESISRGELDRIRTPESLAASISRNKVSEVEVPKSRPMADLISSEELQLQKEPVQIREVGIWPFKRVIVPPNVYVVHTRLGRKEPVTIGLGCSFPYDPYRDSYLVVPAAMQTIGIVANSISREKQGINVLAYVQWQIQDFSVAYRKLDFSDTRDPLGIVNAQLREQAEAAIKDKIATMAVDEVLTDKQPIIEELTARLKAVAEGRGQSSSEGLGIKIVTVQVKEAYVSSMKLWEHLQAPFRHEQAKVAHISQLAAQEEVRSKELENRRLAETSQAETMVQIELIKQNTQTEALQSRLVQEKARLALEQDFEKQRIELSEQTMVSRRQSERRLNIEASKLEQEQKLAALKHFQEAAAEKTRIESEASVLQTKIQVEQELRELSEKQRLEEVSLHANLKRVKQQALLKQEELALTLLSLDHESQLVKKKTDTVHFEETAKLEVEREAATIRHALREKEIELARLRQEVENLTNHSALATRLINKLPEIASQMPDIHELKVLQTGNSDYSSIADFLGRLLAVGNSLGIAIDAKQSAPDKDGL